MHWSVYIQENKAVTNIALLKETNCQYKCAEGTVQLSYWLLWGFLFDKNLNLTIFSFLIEAFKMLLM